MRIKRFKEGDVVEVPAQHGVQEVDAGRAERAHGQPLGKPKPKKKPPAKKAATKKKAAPKKKEE